MEAKRENVGVRKCPKCGSVWYTALPKCAFCGIEGEELKGPIPPSMLNLGRGGVAASAAPKGPPPEPAPAPELPPAAVAPAAAAPAAPSREPDPPMEKKAEGAPTPPAPADSARPVPELPPPPPPLPPPDEGKERPARRPRDPGPRPWVPVGARPEDVGPAVPAAPRLPSATVPLVCGVLGMLACVGLPFLAFVRHDRVLGILCLLGWALLAPLGPCAWFTAERYVERCRVLGFRPSSGSGIGRSLGTLAAFLITLEFSALAVFAAVQVLSGRLTELPWK